MVGYDENSEKQISHLWHGLSGVTSGVLTRFTCQPLDVLKIRFQLQSEPLKKGSQNYYWNVIQATTRIVREESYRGLWKGHVPAQILSGVYGLVQFASFEFLTKKAHEHAEKVPKPITHFLCGSVSGGMATVAGQPFDTMRTRLVGQGEPKIYSGISSAFTSMLKQEGPLSFYKGLVPALVQVVPYTGIQFFTYNVSTRFYDLVTGASESLNRSTTKYVAKEFICGSGSGLAAKLIVYPFDLVKKRLQVQGFEEARAKFGRSAHYSGLFNCLTRVFAEEGFVGLYKGITPSLIKAGFVSGLTFTIYEEVVRSFKGT